MNTIYFHTHETRPDWFPFYDVTWNSLLSVIRDERVVIVSNNASPEMLSRIPKRFEVVSDTTGISGIWDGFSSSLRRWRNSHGDYRDKILFADARDTVFQRNPFDDMPDGGVIFSGEGPLHSGCEWNRDDQTRLQNAMPSPNRKRFDDWQVVCGGIWGGQRQLAQSVALMIVLAGIAGGGTDQAALNYVVGGFMASAPGAAICNPSHNDWCLSGHHFRLVNPPPVEKDGVIYSGSTGRPYAVHHQWDRTVWRELMFKKWGK